MVGSTESLVSALTSEIGEAETDYERYINGGTSILPPHELRDYIEVREIELMSMA